MVESDLTVAILREIRDGIHSLADRVGAVETAVNATNVRLDETNVRLAAVEGKVDRVADHMEAIGRYAKNTSRRHDKAIEDLRERVAKLESRRKN